MSTNRRTFLKQAALGALQLGVITQIYGRESISFKKGTLPRSTPESQSFSSDAILKFVDAVSNSNLHSLMILKNGHVIAEGWWAPYAAEYKHTLYSLSKSFTSTAIGLAAGEGKLDTNDKVASFFPEKLPKDVSTNLAAMRIRDLLSMSTGHGKDTTGQFRDSSNGDWVKAFLAQPVEYQPGTHFVYNSGATYMLSAILKKVTGQNLTTYLKPRLFDPLGIHDYDWETDPAGIEVGGWGLRVRTEDIAKFGQLYLQEGKWFGRQVLPAEWVKEATTSHIMQPGKEEDRPNSDWLQGYGYQFWRCRHHGYRGDGAFGQYCVVMPDQQMVIAITSETNDMQGILNEAWKYLLNPEKEAVRHQEIKPVLAKLALPLPSGAPTSTVLPSVNGSTYNTSENILKITSLSLRTSAKDGVLRISDGEGHHEISFGINQWNKGKTTYPIEWAKLIPTTIPGNPPLHTRASAYWKDDKTFELTCRFIDTAHYIRISCNFGENGLTAEFRKSISIVGNDQKPYATVVGTKKTT